MGDALGVDQPAHKNGHPRVARTRLAPGGAMALPTRAAMLVFLVLLLLTWSPPALEAVSPRARESFQNSIIDQRAQVNRRFKKVRRKKTD